MLGLIAKGGLKAKEGEETSAKRPRSKSMVIRRAVTGEPQNGKYKSQR